MVDEPSKAGVSDRVAASEGKGTSRREYSTPSLFVLGNVTELTRGQGGSNFDSGHQNLSKKGHG